MPFTKIAAETYLPTSTAETPPVVVREYDEVRDKAAVEELERRCEVGQPGKPSLVTDLMGDPIARVRNFMSHIMLVNKLYSQHSAIIEKSETLIVKFHANI